MLYTYFCADIDPDCPATLVGETDAELLKQIHRHIDAAHPDLWVNQPSVETLKSAIRATSISKK